MAVTIELELAEARKRLDKQAPARCTTPRLFSLPRTCVSFPSSLRLPLMASTSFVTPCPFGIHIYKNTLSGLITLQEKAYAIRALLNRVEEISPSH